MPLDPQMQAILDTMPAGGDVDLSQVPPEAMRPAFDSVGPPGDPQVVGNVENRTVPGPSDPIPVRVYTPEGEGPFPILMFFHGGGFVLCSLDSHDALARALCNGAEAVVISVDYRLAPEAKFPAGPEDCYAATCWAAENAGEVGGDAARIAVAGDSAGGNLSAVVSLMAQERGGPSIVHQLLIYPVTSSSADTNSYRDNAEGYFLTKGMMDWFWGHYLENEADGSNPLASPLLAESLVGQPPATVITAEFDPLRDEGLAYARRLDEAGVSTVVKNYEGVVHGFVSMFDNVDKGREALELGCKRLREAFASS
jgi:acetyl esterase